MIKDHIPFVPVTDLKNQFTCEQRPPVFKDPSLNFLGLVFQERFDRIFLVKNSDFLALKYGITKWISQLYYLFKTYFIKKKHFEKSFDRYSRVNLLSASCFISSILNRAFAVNREMKERPRTAPEKKKSETNNKTKKATGLLPFFTFYLSTKIK